MTDAVLANGGKTGHPPGLLQDDCRKLSKWLASRMNARQEVREVCRLIAQEQPMNDKTEQPVTDALRAMSTSNSDLYEYERLQLKDAADTIDKLEEDLAEAKADNERLRADLDRAIVNFGDAAATVGDMRAQLAEAQRDSERLDRMIELRAYVVSDPDCCDGYWLNYLRPDGTVWVQTTEHETPRAAIDAAKGEQ